MPAAVSAGGRSGGVREEHHGVRADALEIGEILDQRDVLDVRI